MLQTMTIGISIHAPREGCDLTLTIPADGAGFQSTHPVRGATDNNVFQGAISLFQSTHPVRGATDAEQTGDLRGVISIHAPREGCDGSPAAPRS